MLSPSSRLTDDLYALYMAAMMWIFLPFWASGLAEVLPSDWEEFDRWFDIAASGVGFLGAWSGIRGGPLMLTRSAIVHELGAPVSKRMLLLPWLARQAVAWALVAGVLATVALVLADRDAFTYSDALAVSLVALLATLSSINVAVALLAALRGGFATKPLLASAAILLAAPVVLLVVAGSFPTAAGMTGLALLAVASSGVAFYALEGVPVPLLWKRAWAVEAVRSSTQSLDFQRVLLDLRNATERPAYGVRRLLVLRRLPRALWRHIAGVQHTWQWHVVRLVAAATLLGLLTWSGATSQGMVALGLAAASLLLGLEVTGALAATADQPTFVVHYPHGSRRVLIGQTTTTIAIASAIAGVVIVGKLTGSVTTTTGIFLIAVAGAIGASIQARLGSPDLAKMISTFGVEQVSAILWLRALLGPLLVIATTVLVFHQFLRPDQVEGPFGAGIAIVLFAGLLVATSPLEKETR